MVSHMARRECGRGALTRRTGTSRGANDPTPPVREAGVTGGRVGADAVVGTGEMVVGARTTGADPGANRAAESPAEPVEARTEDDGPAAAGPDGTGPDTAGLNATGPDTAGPETPRRPPATTGEAPAGTRLTP